MLYCENSFSQNRTYENTSERISNTSFKQEGFTGQITHRKEGTSFKNTTNYMHCVCIYIYRSYLVSTTTSSMNIPIFQMKLGIKKINT